MGGVTSRPGLSSTGFSLLELLLAMAVMLLLLFLSMAGYSRLIESSAVDAGAQMVNDLLTEGRQEAITQNTIVEVRLYDLTSPASGAIAYGSLQLHLLQPDGTTPSVAPVVILPVTAVIDATAAHSSLVTTNTETATADATDWRIDPLTRAFHFLPNGSTDLAATGKWLLTLRAASRSDPANFPENWACVELDPVTGRAQIYRP